jgi:hypothetical protein
VGERAAAIVASHPDHHVYIHNIRPRRGQHGNVRWVDVGDDFWHPDRLARLGVTVAHLHFGFELIPRDLLGHWVDSLRRHGIGLVHTVHDLENPHLVQQTEFQELVGDLVAAADALVTLTDGAAAETARRWGRRPTVIAHPHVADHPFDGSVVRTVGGLANLGMPRPNLDLDALSATADALAGEGCSFHVHIEPRGLAEASRIVRRRLEGLARHPATQLIVAPRCSDDDLWLRLRRTMIVLLPYRWGTHSGLLEAARDCGAVPLAPQTVGHYVEQGAAPYASPLHISDAIGALLRDRSLANPTSCIAEQRMVERDTIAAAHDAIYRRLSVQGRMGRHRTVPGGGDPTASARPRPNHGSCGNIDG